MEIDLDKILSYVKPRPVVISYEGRKYPLRRYTIADLAALERINTQADGESLAEAAERLIAFLAGLFEGDPPPFLGRKLADVPEAEQTLVLELAAATLHTVTAIFVAESNREKKLALAAAETSRQLELASETTEQTTASTT